MGSRDEMEADADWFSRVGMSACLGEMIRKKWVNPRKDHRGDGT